MGQAKSFDTIVAGGAKGPLVVPAPFDPNTVWGKKPVHHVTGTVGSCSVRGQLTPTDNGFALKLGPAWRRDNSVKPGDTVRVTLSPEGPQRDALDPDIAAALEAEPKAAAFFDGLAQFYRKGFLTWIAATQRKPEERARRIKETVKLLKAGVKERPR